VDYFEHYTVSIKKSDYMHEVDEEQILGHLRDNPGDYSLWLRYAMFLLGTNRFDEAISAGKEIAAQASAKSDLHPMLLESALNTSAFVVGFSIMLKALNEASPFLERCGKSNGGFAENSRQVLTDVRDALRI